MIQLLTLGHFREQAARQVGVTGNAISMRCKRDSAFRMRVEQAEATFEFSMIAVMVKASAKDWRAAREALRGRFRERWGDDATTKISVKQTATTSAVAVAEAKRIWEAAVATVPSLAGAAPVAPPPDAPKEPAP